jgi:hypothetical protein
MPRGIYKRSKKQVEHCKTINIGRIPWNKGKKGVQKDSEETKLKKRELMIGNIFGLKVEKII